MSRPAILPVLACLLVAAAAAAAAEDDTTWDKIKNATKGAYDTAYEGVHCAFHKAKELVSPHQHAPGEDPCNPQAKPAAAGTPPPADVQGL